MTIFDDLINKTNSLLTSESKTFQPKNDFSNKTGSKSELILGKEAAFELGGENKYSAAYSLFTEDETIVNTDEIVICGKDIYKLNTDCSFARIAIIRTEGAFIHGEQAAYSILETINLKRYDVFPKGYMIRTSVLSNREQVKVSKKAVKEKLSFVDVGSMYINEFKKNKYVKAVKIIFVTNPEINYQKLEHISSLATELFRALNHAVTDLKMDCKHCEWKFLCDEVDGMKDLHNRLIKK